MHSLKGRYYLAPVQNPDRICDIGTGTGIWAIEVAEQNPQAVVTGTDLSPIQLTWVPPNAFFEVDDYNVEWLDENKYDLIHARELLGSCPDWTELYHKAHKALKPGGWFEQHEPSLFFYSDLTTFQDRVPSLPFQCGMSSLLELRDDEESKHKSLVRTLWSCMIFSSDVMANLVSQPAGYRVLLAVEDSFTCCAPLLAWTCAVYEAFEIRIAIAPTTLTDMKCKGKARKAEVTSWESAIEAGHISYMGLHFERHWFRLQSKEIARVWAHWEHINDKVIEPRADDMVVGFLR